MWCYSNNGLSCRWVPAGYQPQAGEQVFSTLQTPSQLAAAFPGYSAAAAAAALAVSAQALMAAGCEITSTSTPALNGTYPTDPVSQQYVAAEVTSILLNGTFTDGSSTIAWLDATGAAHSFSIAQFKTLATALGAFVSGCLKCINGQSTTLPSQPSTIP